MYVHTASAAIRPVVAAVVTACMLLLLDCVRSPSPCAARFNVGTACNAMHAPAVHAGPERGVVWCGVTVSTWH